MKLQAGAWDRLLRVLVPLVILAGIILAAGTLEKEPMGPDTASVYVQATVTQVLEDHTGGEPFVGVQRVEATITSGQFAGRSCELENANSYQTGALCQEGTRVIAYVRQDAEGQIRGAVYNYDRTGMVYLLIGLFAVILLLIGGKKGAAALYALVFTFACVLCVYIPLLYIGTNGILAATVTAVLILAVSIYIINGWSVKSLCAVIGTTVGVMISGVIAMAVGGAASLSGYNSDYVEALLGMDARIDIGGLLYAGVLISSLGAVMDVSVSVVAAMQEIREKAPRLKATELFASGMRVGHDMMGTMSNTLILAYAGSATSVLLYTFGMPYLKIMGDNDIMIEILSGLCGTIGVILTVPIQAGITALVLQPKEKKKR
ncbi:MAG: YibE/F family protein [Oscillospiraceae bacterium]|nr:YibE/F family protein [Oscillospiraceae bacterium]